MQSAQAPVQVISLCDVTSLGTGKTETRGVCHSEVPMTRHTANLEGLCDVAETLVQLALGSLHLL